MLGSNFPLTFSFLKQPSRTAQSDPRKGAHALDNFRSGFSSKHEAEWMTDGRLFVKLGGTKAWNLGCLTPTGCHLRPTHQDGRTAAIAGCEDVVRYPWRKACRRTLQHARCSSCLIRPACFDNCKNMIIQSSYRSRPELLSRYPFHDKTIVVTRCDRICLGNKKINFSQVAGIKEVHDDNWWSVLWSMIWVTSIWRPESSRL